VRVLHFAIGVGPPARFDLTAPSVEREIGTSGAEVRGITLSGLLEHLGWDYVDLMKIDVEGAEFAVFADPSMHRVGAIIGEVHDTKAPAGYTSVEALLPDYDVRSSPAVGGAATMFHALRQST
jgi:hypothetical protein